MTNEDLRNAANESGFFAEQRLVLSNGRERLYIAPGHVSGRIWIGRWDGEGGDFDVVELFDAVNKFYRENL